MSTFEKELSVALAGRMLPIVDFEILKRDYDLSVRASFKKELHANGKHAAVAVLRIAQLQSVANWIHAEAQERLTRLEAELVSEVRQGKPMDKLFASAQKRINNAFRDIEKKATAHLNEVIKAVSDKTRSAVKLHHGVDTKDAQVPAAEALHVLGATLSESFSKLAYDTLFKFRSAIRQGVTNNDTVEGLVTRIEGEDAAVTASEAVHAAEAGPSISVRLFDAVENTVNKVIENAIASFANAATAAGGASEAEDRNIGWEWVAIHDEKCCDICEFYDGNRWTKEYEPVDDAPEYPGDPPAHRNCRCAVITSDLDEEPAAQFSFDDYLGQFSRSEQEQAFGKANLRAYRRGDITANQLIGQKSNLMTLEDFKNLL